MYPLRTTTRPDSTSTHTRRNAGGRLAREWNHLRIRPAALRRAAEWGLVGGPLHDLGQILAAVGYEIAPSPATEQQLRQLVLLAADDELAARVVVQRILPGLIALVRRRKHLADGHDTLEELLGAAWIAIRTFNPARRPVCLAAALIDDADRRAFRSRRRRPSADELPTDLTGARDDVPAPASDHPRDELARLFVLAIQSGVPVDDIELLRLLLSTPRVIDLAQDLAVTPRTVRNRRDRITSRLREVALAG